MPSVETSKTFLRLFGRSTPNTAVFQRSNEALEWLKTNGRYSGEWEDNFRPKGKTGRADSRLYRAEISTLRCCPREAKPSVSLDRGRFAWWVEQKFGSTMTAKIKDISRSEIITTGKDGPLTPSP